MLPTKQTWRICCVLNECQKLSVCSVQSESCRKAEQLHFVTFISVTNSLLVPERFLHSQGKGGLHNSFYIKQLALAFPSFGCLKLSHLYLSGLSVEHWWGLCLLPKWITVGFWVFTVVLFQFFKSLLVLPTFVGSLNEWGNSFSFWANDWELNSVLQNSTCKLESLTLKKNPRNNKTGPKTQAQNSEWKYILIFIINAGSALCVLYFTFTQPDL